MLRRRGVIIAAALLFGVGYAHAGWLYKGEASAFGGAGSQIVLVVNDRYGFGVRCDGGVVTTIYLTPEEVSEKEFENATAAGTLMVKIDDLAPLTADATPDSADGHLRVSAEFNDDLLNELKAAKHRVAVAIKLGDRIFHESTFVAQGASKALGQFISACPAAAGAKG
ncbi:hypothetical protein PY650_30960 [Rhizobium calliandrae]|uniref:Uncharacterized protein n=1 Tax=Rhizobium calliandrae TaxID=1312182 RepID=A0ABT7KMW5_9HYPH|nr:hypothetical protein [Rhizobium calliandrae]MDL2409960.1 hypothetical protein [Rhizobium calliandrae]